MLQILRGQEKIVHRNILLVFRHYVDITLQYYNSSDILFESPQSVPFNLLFRPLLRSIERPLERRLGFVVIIAA